MNELIVIMDQVKDRYKAYEDLLIRRDQLSRDAGSYQTAYIKAFGDMVAANFALKVECIKKKKTISYCRRRMNRGLTINTDLMQSEIEEEMRLYQLRNREEPDMESYADEEHKAILEEERRDYERCLEILQKNLDDIFASIDVKNQLTVR